MKKLSVLFAVTVFFSGITAEAFDVAQVGLKPETLISMQHARTH